MSLNRLIPLKPAVGTDDFAVRCDKFIYTFRILPSLSGIIVRHEDDGILPVQDFLNIFHGLCKACISFQEHIENRIIITSDDRDKN